MSSEIKVAHREFAEKIQAAIEFKIENDVAVGEINKTFYVENLPAGIDADLIRMVNGYNEDLNLAGGLAIGNAGLELMKKNKNIKSATLRIPMVGRDHVDFEFTREYDKRIPATGETVAAFGRITSNHNLHSFRKTGGWTDLKTHLAEIAEKAFSK